MTKKVYRKSVFSHFWNGTTTNAYICLFIHSLILTVVSYIPINSNSQIFDYSFHMARIIGLAQSLDNGDYLPHLNYLFINASGYGVPMFYGNGLLYIPALVYLLSKTATVAFSSYAFLIILGSAWLSYYSLYQITNDKNRAFLFGLTMAAVYPFFGYGMTAVVPLIPILVYCIYKVLYKNKLNPVLLGVIIAFLLQTHILSTIVLAISMGILVLFAYKKWSWRKFLSFLASIFLAILLSIGFIFQYLEQIKSQLFFVSWGLRDYPFKSSWILDAGSIIDVIRNFFFPLTLLFLFVGYFFYKQLPMLSRHLLLLSLVLLVSASNILPWQSILKYSFLAVL